MKWSDADLKRLRELYPVESWKVILREFPARTKASIRNKIITLEVRRAVNSRTKWLGSELVILRGLYPAAPWPVILAKIPRHPQGAIAKQANSMGLRRDGATCKSRYRVIRELREIRRNSGEKRENVARRMGCNVVQLSKWERGEQYPRLERFFMWVEEMGCRLELRRVRD